MLVKWDYLHGAPRPVRLRGAGSGAAHSPRGWSTHRNDGHTGAFPRRFTKYSAPARWLGRDEEVVLRDSRQGQHLDPRLGQTLVSLRITPLCTELRIATTAWDETAAGGPIVQSGWMRYAVAASSEWVDPDGVRRPGGEVHAWTPSANQTLCGLALSRSRLGRYPHVDWDDIRPESGRHADAVRRVCPRCMAGTRSRRDARQRRGQGAGAGGLRAGDRARSTSPSRRCE